MSEEYSQWRGRQPFQYWVNKPEVVYFGSAQTALGKIIRGGDSTIRNKKQAQELEDNLRPIQEQIVESVSAGFQRGGGQEPLIWTPGYKIDRNDYEFSRVFSFAFLGGLTEEGRLALAADNIEDFRGGLRRSIAETDVTARKLKRAMKVRELAPHLSLFALFEDNEGIIESAGHERTRWFGRSQMAKLGSSSVNTVLYTTAKSGEVKLKGITRNTLEGGHPFFPTDALDELGYREKITAAMSPVKIDVERAKDQINLDFWKKSGAVKGIRRSGQLFGELGYLSESVYVKEMVMSAILAFALEKESGWKQQGEGAFWAQEILLALTLSSATGQMEAVKADLHLEDVVALRVLPDGSTERVTVKDLIEKLSSVEGPEFAKAVEKMRQDHPIWVKFNEDGSGFTVNERGGKNEHDGIVMAPTWAGGHLHREAIPTDSKRVRHLNIDPRRHPTYGCGVDGSFELTHDYFRLATDMWEESGRTIEIITVNRAGHGTDYIQFPVFGKVNTTDHSIPLKEVTKTREFRMAPEVRQVEERIAPWAKAA